MASPFGWLPRSRWKRWMLTAFLAAVLVVLGLVNLVGTGVIVWQNPKVQSRVMLTLLGRQSRQPVEIPVLPRLSPEEATVLLTNAASVSTPEELFRPTNVWDVQVTFTGQEWTQLGPSNVVPIIHFFQPDGSVILRNPQASRNGLAGVFGLDFPWSSADLNFGGAEFKSIAARFKGNGTFVNSQRSYKRPFKFELTKKDKNQRFAGIKTINLHNLTADPSCLSDTLGYEFFRDASVPAPRTAFARVRLSIKGRFEDRLLGLYVLVENLDSQWAKAQFGIEGVGLFKPVTYELFKDLGDDWQAYEGIYDPKTKLKREQIERLITLAKLVTHANDQQFSEQIGDFIDLDEFARFLACQVMLSNYDGFLSNGQNFLLYLDPRTQKFGFIPWDLDQCWGKFGFVGTSKQREQASLWHPWVGQNHFLDRMLRVSAMKTVYRQHLERLRATLFVPARLSQRLDELTPVVRPFIAEESSQRLARFERETGNDATLAAGGVTNSAPRGFRYRHFFAVRADSITAQLDGRKDGMVLNRGRGR